MPIKTRIDVGADTDKFRQSYASFEKYRTALKALYGEQVERAPFIKAASDAGGQVLRFIDLDKAARSQTNFATAAQKASHAFRGLGTGVKNTLESFARIALSPLEMLFPAGLAVGLLGLGAGLVGAGTFYGLERGAAGVSDRRRQAMGLGVSYGSLSAYDLNFSRFGVGQDTLGAVAGGIYDFTSPEYMGLMNAGALGHGDTSEAAIDLIRSIPKIFATTPDGQIGRVAHSRGLDSLLDLQTIVRLKNHPEEIEDQVKRYQQDRKALDISKDAQEKWASFDAAISRAGRDIETVLGRNLVALTPGLTKFSDDAVKLIGAFVDSGAMTNALNGIRSGLQWVEDSLGSSGFKQSAKLFLSGLATLGPYIDRFVNGPLAKGLLLAGRGLYYGADLFGNPNYNPSLGGLVGDVFGVRGQDGGHRTSTGLGGSSIRYYAGRCKERPPYGGVIDSATGRLLPTPGFRYSPGYRSPTQPPSAVTSEDGSVVLPAVTDQNRAYRNTGTITLPGADGKPHTYSFVTGGGGRGSAPTGTYDVGEFATGGAIGDRWTLTETGHPHDTAFDPDLNADRSALRIHMAHGDRTLGCIGILGGDRVFADFENDLMYVVKKNGGHVRLRLGSPDAASITNRMTPTSSGAAAVRSGALPSRPVSTTPVHNWGPWHAGGTPSGAIIDAPSPASSGVDAALAESVDDRFAEMQRNRNPSLKRRGGHILDHMDHGPPPGPIVIDNQSGGSVQVTVSRHMASQ
jgi:hypothetical protein